MGERLMAVFLCRWPNGDVSIISARTKREAIVHLDEFANADRAMIVRMNDFLIDLNLNDQGELELSRFGDATHEELMERAYPVLWETLTSDALLDLTEDSPQFDAIVLDAVRLERNRLRAQRRRLPAAKTELGRALQQEHDFPAAMVDDLVDESADKLLVELDSDIVH